MKRIYLLLTAALLLALCAVAWAEDGVNVEVIKMDGVSVVVFTPRETLERVSDELVFAKSAPSGFTLPALLTEIGEEAFAGIDAERVEVSENVAIIQARAFANCGNLKQIAIPDSVQTIDDSALDGCANVTVIGRTGSEAQRFATANGFDFYAADAEQPNDPKDPQTPVNTDAPPVELPFVQRR